RAVPLDERVLIPTAVRDDPSSGSGLDPDVVRQRGRRVAIDLDHRIHGEVLRGQARGTAALRDEVLVELVDLLPTRTGPEVGLPHAVLGEERRELFGPTVVDALQVPSDDVADLVSVRHRGSSVTGVRARRTRWCLDERFSPRLDQLFANHTCA